MKTRSGRSFHNPIGFRHKVLGLLRRRGLLSEEGIELLLSWRRSGFSVHNRVYAHPGLEQERENKKMAELYREHILGETPKPASPLIQLEVKKRKDTEQEPTATAN